MQQVQRTQTNEINATQSLNLVKNLLRSGLSCIAFMRGMFPIECFKKQKISGVTVHTLQSTEPEPKKLIDWIDQGCLPSLEKRYLEELVFAIYANLDSTNAGRFYLIESYNFQIRYHENDVVMTRKSDGVEVSRTVPTKSEISQATVSMIRSLISMGGTMPPLPENRAFSMKLLYREDITPEDYEPVHFRPVTSEHELRFFSKPEAVAIGNIATPYHELSLNIMVPGDCEKELASRFFISPRSDLDTGYPAYGATINDCISSTLSEHVSETFRESRHENSDVMGGSSTCLQPNAKPEEHDRCDSSEPVELTPDKGMDIVTSQGENHIQPDSPHLEFPLTRRRSPSMTFPDVHELLKAVQAKIYQVVPDEIEEISASASEKLKTLISLYASSHYDTMKVLYLQLEIFLLLHGSAPYRLLRSVFRGTKLNEALMRDHLNGLVDIGLATRTSKGLVVAVKERPQKRMIAERPEVSDDTETMETTQYVTLQNANTSKATSQTQKHLDHLLPSKIQKHIQNGVLAWSQDDNGVSQFTKYDSKIRTTKRKVSTSDDIYQVLAKRQKGQN